MRARPYVREAQSVLATGVLSRGEAITALAHPPRRAQLAHPARIARTSAIRRLRLIRRRDARDPWVSGSVLRAYVQKMCTMVSVSDQL